MIQGYHNKEKCIRVGSFINTLSRLQCMKHIMKAIGIKQILNNSELLLGRNTRNIRSYDINNILIAIIPLTRFISHTCAKREVEHSAWCTVHGLVAQHELSVVACDHFQRAFA